MKLIILLLLSFCSYVSLAQTDSARLKKLEAQTSELNTKMDSIGKQLKQFIDKQTAANKPLDAAAHDTCDRKLSAGAVLLVLAPIILFILAFWILRVKLKKNTFHISDALSTFKTETKSSVTRSLALDGTVSGGTVEQQTADKQVRSSSRLLAFLTGMVALIIAIVLTSYTGYVVVTGCSTDVNVDGLWKILVALGIGVIPYGANVMNGNGKENTQVPVTK